MERVESLPTIYRCQRCGRQSPVEAVFVAKKRADGSLVRCLCFECESKRVANATLLLYVLVPVFGLLILLTDPYSRLGVFYLLVFAGLVLSIPLIILHEFSHALIAQALGFRVFAIHLGLGKVLLSRRFWGITWTVHLIPSSAVTLVSGPEMRRYRLRTFLIHLAGPAFHGLLIALLLWIKSILGFSGTWYGLALWTNVCLLALNLFPYKTYATTGPTGTDGWAMLKAPRLTPEDLRVRYASFYILETASAMESGNFQAARQFAEKGIALYPQDPNMLNTLGYAYVNSQEYHKSRQTFLQALHSSENLPMATKALLMNNVAFANLLLDDPALLPEADSFSEQAYQALSWEPVITGTRGGVLVALDRPDEGIELLKQAMSKNSDKRSKAMDACLTAWGEWKRGNRKESESYLMLARRLDPECALLAPIRDKIQPGS
jgi:membrane-associated protease RseP (regulator of RpoE activity)